MEKPKNYTNLWSSLLEEMVLLQVMKILKKSLTMTHNQRRKGKQSASLVSVTQRAVFDEVGADLDAFLNKANSECHIYEVFHEQIISEGEIGWRYHED